MSSVALLPGRTRASQLAREQAAGQTRLVVATSAPQVLAEAAAPATAEVPNTTILDSDALGEDGGEWIPTDVQPGSLLKRHKDAGQPHKDSSAKHSRHTVHQAPSSTLLQAPLLTVPSSPTHSSCHSLPVSRAAPTRSNPNMAQQVSGPGPHTGMTLSVSSAPCPPHSMASQPTSTQYTSYFSSPQLKDDNTQRTNLYFLNPPSNGGAGNALQHTQNPTNESQSEWREITDSGKSAKIPGHLICLGGGEVNAFMSSAGLTVLSLLDTFHCMGHTTTQAGDNLATFMHRNKEDVLLLELVRARRVGARGSPKLFASAEVTLCVINKYWAYTEETTKMRFFAGKELLMSDLRALIPKVRDVAKPKSSPRLLETSEMGYKAAQPYTGDASKPPPHRTVSEDVSSCRMDPVPISSTNDPLWKKKNDLFTSVLNVMRFLALDSEETSAVMSTMQNMTDQEVAGYMGTSHLCMRHAWIDSDKTVMRDLITGLVKRGH